MMPNKPLVIHESKLKRLIIGGHYYNTIHSFGVNIKKKKKNRKEKKKKKKKPIFKEEERKRKSYYCYYFRIK